MERKQGPFHHSNFALAIILWILVIIGFVTCSRYAFGNDDLPPARYDHPYPGPVIEWVLPYSEVIRVCKGLRKENLRDLRACILFFPNYKGDRCYVVLPKVGAGGTTQSYQDILRRHEIGHCNGWPSIHSK